MKKSQDDIYRQIREAIDNLPDNFSILEEQIDIDMQLQYFNFSKELKSEFSKDYILKRKNDLFDETIAQEEKKNLLVLLASVNEVEAYRTIEKFVKNPAPGLKDWSILALQESRMLLQSTLLDEQQVFISTGLGGQGQRLRYFAVLRPAEPCAMFTKVQKQIIESELIFSIKNHDGIFEEIEFEDDFVKALFLMPLKSDMQEMFRAFVDECNQYGNFLNEDVILTNVRKLDIREIRSFLKNEFTDDDEKQD